MAESHSSGTLPPRRKYARVHRHTPETFWLNVDVKSPDECWNWFERKAVEPVKEGWNTRGEHALEVA